jgi:hypothetical protein
MTVTVNTSYIGTGYNYSTLADWITAKGGDLVTDNRKEITVIMGGQNPGPCDFSTSTTNDNCYFEITTGISDEYTGDAQFDSTLLTTPLHTEVTLNSYGKSYILWTGKNFKIGSAYVTISNMILVSVTASDNVISGFDISGQCNLDLKNCFVILSSGYTGSTATLFSTSDYRGSLINCICYISGFDSYAVLSLPTSSITETDNICNCSFFAYSSTPASAIGYILDVADKINVVNTSILTDSSNVICFGNTIDGGKLYACASSDSSISTNYSGKIFNCLENVILSDNVVANTAKLTETSVLRKSGIIRNNNAKSDIWGTIRLKYDIGAVQSLNVNSTEINEIFTDLKLFIKSYYQYTDVLNDYIDAQQLAKSNVFKTTIDKLSILADIIKSDASNKSTITGFADGETTLLKSYISSYVLSLMDVLDSGTITNILDKLDYWMALNNITIKGISLGVSVQNIVSGDGTLNNVTVPQMIKPQMIEVKCNNTDTAGEENWTLTGTINTSFDNATTGIAYTDTQTGLTFTINAQTGGYVENDTFRIFVTQNNIANLQAYFRNNLDYIFNQSVTNNTETISDTL